MSTVPPSSDGIGVRSPGRVEFWCVVAGVVAAIVPIVVALLRALHHGWLPVGDDAFFVVRSRDVFNQHRPLLGTWTSASLTAGIDFNNPGPLLFDALAPFVAVGTRSGIAVGAAVMNALAVVGIVVVAVRRGGSRLGALAAFVSAALAWSMGSELLYDPWQPHVLLLPFLCFLVFAWALACGDLWMLPWLVVVGSLVVQSHVSYAVLVPVIALWAVAVAAFVTWRRARGKPESRRLLVTRGVRAGAVAGAVLVLAWVQPMIEQFTSDGDGNLTRLAHASQDSAGAAGWDYAVKAVAAVLALPPMWARPSINRTLFGDGVWHAPSAAGAAAGLGVLAIVLTVTFVFAWRRRDLTTVLAVATTIVATLVGLFTVARAPVTFFGPLTPHSSRWMWAVGAFTLFAIGAAVLRALPRRWNTAVVGGLTALTLVVAIANLPSAPTRNGPQSQQWAIPGTRRLDHQLHGLAGKGPYLVDGLFNRPFDPYGIAVVAELQRRNLPFVVHESRLVRQLGPERRYDGHNARSELVLGTGDNAFTPAAGSRRVALFEALTPAEHRELDDLRRAVAHHIDSAGALRLTDHGRLARESGDLPLVDRQLGSGAIDGHSLVESGELLAMVEAGDLVVDPAWRARFERFAMLQRAWDDHTVGIFVRPIRGPAA
jgi:hypothetical protein